MIFSKISPYDIIIIISQQFYVYLQYKYEPESTILPYTQPALPANAGFFMPSRKFYFQKMGTKWNIFTKIS